MRLTRHLALLVAAIVLLVACGDGDADTAQDPPPQAEEVAQDASEATKDALASLRTDAERLLDEIRTQDAPRFKEELLERCRDALERLRQAESDAAQRAEQLCSRIQDTDVANADAWSDIKREIDQLDVGS